MVAYAPYISEQQHPGSGKFRDEWNGIAITQPWDAPVRGATIALRSSLWTSIASRHLHSVTSVSRFPLGYPHKMGSPVFGEIAESGQPNATMIVILRGMSGSLGTADPQQAHNNLNLFLYAQLVRHSNAPSLFC